MLSERGKKQMELVTQRLTEFAPEETRSGYVKIDDVLGLDLVITDAEFREGDYGEYVVFQAYDQMDNTYTIASGAGALVNALHNALAANALPVAARFARQGKKIVIL